MNKNKRISRLERLETNGIIVDDMGMVKAILKETDKKELDLILTIISNVQKNKDDDIKEGYKIPFSELTKLYCPSNPRTKEVEDAVRKMLKDITSCSFCYEPNKDTEIFMPFVIYAKMDKKNEYVTIKLSEDIKKIYLEVNEKCLKYRLKYILELSTLCDVRLYQWAYSKKGFCEKGKPVNISIEDAKRIFRGKRDMETGYFIEKSLDPSIAKINKITDLNLTYEKIYANRKKPQMITSLRFNIECSYGKPKRERTPAQIDSDNKKNRNLAVRVGKLEDINKKEDIERGFLWGQMDMMMKENEEQGKRIEQLEKIIEELAG